MPSEEEVSEDDDQPQSKQPKKKRRTECEDEECQEQQDSFNRNSGAPDNADALDDTSHGDLLQCNEDDSFVDSFSGSTSTPKSEDNFSKRKGGFAKNLNLQGPSCLPQNSTDQSGLLSLLVSQLNNTQQERPDFLSGLLQHLQAQAAPALHQPLPLVQPVVQPVPIVQQLVASMRAEPESPVHPDAQAVV